MRRETLRRKRSRPKRRSLVDGNSLQLNKRQTAKSGSEVVQEKNPTKAARRKFGRKPSGTPTRSKTGSKSAPWGALLIFGISALMIYALQEPLSANARSFVTMQMTAAIAVLAVISWMATRRMPTNKVAIICVSMAAAMVLNTRLRVRDYDDTSIDLFIIIQGLIFLSYCVIGATLFFEKLPKIKKPAIVSVSILGAFCFVSLVNAPNFGYSAFSTVALIATLLFATYCATVLSARDMAVAIVLSTLPMVVLSFITFLNPSSAEQFLWNYDAFTEKRLRGIFNNPVALALASAMLILGLASRAFFVKKRSRFWVTLALVFIPIAITCMWASVSRGPTAGALLALMIGPIFSYRIFGRLTILGILFMSALVVPLLYFAITEGLTEENLSFFARSGDAQEVATLTGRTTIWSESLGHIASNPLIGYGMGSPLVLLESIGYGDFIVVEAHNLFLNAALMVGLPGAVALGFLQFYGLRRSYLKRDSVAMIFLIFFTISGITENFYFPNRPNWYSLIFYATILSVCRHSVAQVQRDVPRRNGLKKSQVQKQRKLARGSAVMPRRQK